MPTRPLHALITGGNRGIGLAIARLFAANSYRCTLIARDKKTLKDAVDSLTPLKPTPTPSSEPSSDPSSDPSSEPSSTSTTTLELHHRYISGDLQDAQFWTHKTFPPPLAKEPSRLDGFQIDALVHCAGVTQSRRFEFTSQEEIESIVNTNLTSLMLGTRFFLRHRYIQGIPRPERTPQGGRSPVIINISSLLGLQGGEGAVAYAASKAGVLGFTRALATEIGPKGVRVNAIVPGYIETDMTKDLNRTALAEKIPLRRFGKPEEIASAALFLAQNQYAHNCVINLDGGLSAV